jgi:hypothetical protein
MQGGNFCCLADELKCDGGCEYQPENESRAFFSDNDGLGCPEGSTCATISGFCSSAGGTIPESTAAASSQAFASGPASTPTPSPSPSPLITPAPSFTEPSLSLPSFSFPTHSANGSSTKTNDMSRSMIGFGSGCVSFGAIMFALLIGI